MRTKINRRVRFQLPTNKPATTSLNENSRPYPRHVHNSRPPGSSRVGELSYIPSPSLAKYEHFWRHIREPSGPTYITPLLSAASPSSRLISYDFLNPPSTLMSFYALDVLFSPVSSVSSSAPSHIRISTKAGYFRWTMAIVVYSVPTIADVLAGIYKGMQIPVTAEEYETLSWEAQCAVVGAYRKRCARRGQQMAIQDELRRGVRRIDFLAGKTRFAGVLEGRIWEFFVE